MKNRIDILFENKGNNILSVFFIAGFPKLEHTVPVLESLEMSEVDMIEIGIPFSDPLADGPVIQQSSMVALENGMNLKLLFHQIKDLRSITQKPVLLMGYLNSVLQFGTTDFYKYCSEVGIDGVILPDLPIEEYKKHHQAIAEELNIKVVFLISPETKMERIKLLEELTSGFLYVLSSNSTTGSIKGISEKLEIKLKEIKKPKLIGFGIKGNREFSAACKIASGAIIGSAFIKLLENSGNLKTDITEFALSVKF